LRWRDLEPWMDYFGDLGARDKELHQRKAGRTLEDWTKEQPLYKEFQKKKTHRLDFGKELRAYLKSDVMCLFQVLEALGNTLSAELGVDIRTKPTLGSIAEHVWLHTLLKRIPKLSTQAQHDLWQRANRGGFCGPLSVLDSTAPEGQFHYKVDVGSLYPSCAQPVEYVTQPVTYDTSLGRQEPLKAWYCGFPDPSVTHLNGVASGGWDKMSFGGSVMGPEEYESLKDMHGICEVEFDQSALAFPFFVMKMAYNNFETLAPVMKGREHYIVPHIRMAYDMGVRIKLYVCTYTTATCEPFQEYMQYFGGKKLAADKVKDDALKALGKLSKTKQDQDTKLKGLIKKAEFDREFSKTAGNSLLGRVNQRIDRPQTLVTMCPNDVACLLGDGLNYTKADVDPFTAGNEDVIRVKFREGTYKDNIDHFQVCPYLTAYMLGYSKMLMQCSFQFLVSIGAKLLYTDTDSIVFQATPEQWTLYAERFVPIVKTGGGMVQEGVFSKTRIIGPKKYACMEANGDYEWYANGVPARNNVHEDMWERFGEVLEGKHIYVDYFSITTAIDYRLHHSTEAKKLLRHICLKGSIEEDAIRWWRDQEEFKTYAESLIASGTGEEEAVPACQMSTTPACQMSNAPVRKPVDQKPLRHCIVKRPKPTVARKRNLVYILQCVDDLASSYVGLTTNLEQRLRQHNKGRGAMATKGRKWQYFAMYQASPKFEKALQAHSVDHCDEWPQIARRLMETCFPKVIRI
jgi:predicted GIY-YIG superfamily endonuclease